MLDLIVFPSSYFDKNCVDEDYFEEYVAAKNTELFDFIFFGYNKWYNEQALLLNKVPEDRRKAVYRGWMMNPEEYALFYQFLLEYNIELVTTPEEYERMHFFPNVYKRLEPDTAKMEIYPLNHRIDVNDLKTRFGRFMIKDFVKSVKGTIFPSFFDSGISQKEFNRWMEEFYKYRGGMLSGGICVKEYLSLKCYEGKTNEFRVFYMNHRVATVSRNSGQSIQTNLVPMNLVNKYSNLESLYYTIDYAELSDGSWKVIEAGDGGVSGLPETLDKKKYYELLYAYFK